jgi:DNA polymerase III subunit alpha
MKNGSGDIRKAEVMKSIGRREKEEKRGDQSASLNPDQAVHPFAGRLTLYTTTDSSGIQTKQAQETVTVGGIVRHIEEIRTKRNETMACVIIEDLKGTMEIVFFADTYKKYHRLIQGMEPVIVTGTAECVGESAEMIGMEVHRLPEEPVDIYF